MRLLQTTKTSYMIGYIFTIIFSSSLKECGTYRVFVISLCLHHTQITPPGQITPPYPCHSGVPSTHYRALVVPSSPPYAGHLLSGRSVSYPRCCLPTSSSLRQARSLLSDRPAQRRTSSRPGSGSDGERTRRSRMTESLRWKEDGECPLPR